MRSGLGAVIFAAVAFGGNAKVQEGFRDVIASGGWHTCALRESGEVSCWGANDHGQATSSVWLPVKVTAVQSKPMDKLNVGVATSITSATVRMHSSVRLLAVLGTLAPSVWMARSCAGEVMSTAEVPVRRVVGL